VLGEGLALWLRQPTRRLLLELEDDLAVFIDPSACLGILPVLYFIFAIKSALVRLTLAALLRLLLIRPDALFSTAGAPHRFLRPPVLSEIAAL